jgi:hypothetical protein
MEKERERETDGRTDGQHTERERVKAHVSIVIECTRIMVIVIVAT